MKYILILIIMVNFLFGAKVYHKSWEKGKTFSQYLKEEGISADLLESKSKEDQLYLSEIGSRYKYYELKNDVGTLLQALIPISTEMQIHLVRKHQGSGYTFDIIPIAYKNHEYFAKIVTEKNPYTDTLKNIKEPRVAKKISRVFKDHEDAKKLQKGDEISFVYTQRTRLGVPFGMPSIKVGRIKRKDKELFIYVDEDGLGYKETDKTIAYTVMGKKKVTYTRRVISKKVNSRFGMPLRHIRVTSSFSYRRYHPILHRYRPHHGTDFGARRGTPLLAVNDGKVIFAGRMGGYGNVIKIKHPGGYMSLYAHQSRFRVKRGQKVKKGQIIGYVGSTGRSTGPHLHFGLKKNGRWIDPMKVLRKKSIKTSILKKFTKYKNVKITKYKKVNIKDTKRKKEILLTYLKNNAPSYIWGNEKVSEVYFKDKEKFINEK
jgi:murein DD-endopeptidase MepM/ murein hydrolase activator NlpD